MRLLVQIPIHLLLVGVERVNLLEEITKKKTKKTKFVENSKQKIMKINQNITKRKLQKKQNLVHYFWE